MAANTLGSGTICFDPPVRFGWGPPSNDGGGDQQALRGAEETIMREDGRRADHPSNNRAWGEPETRMHVALAIMRGKRLVGDVVDEVMKVSGGRAHRESAEKAANRALVTMLPGIKD